MEQIKPIYYNLNQVSAYGLNDQGQVILL